MTLKRGGSARRVGPFRVTQVHGTGPSKKYTVLNAERGEEEVYRAETLSLYTPWGQRRTIGAAADIHPKAQKSETVRSYKTLVTRKRYLKGVSNLTIN